MVKLTDLINNSDRFTFSFEVTPDVAIEELDKEVEPLFYSVTWHAKTHQNKSLDIAPLRLAKQLKVNNKEVLLHLSCDLLRKEFLVQLLAVLKEYQICNLFVILGERYDPETSDFKTSEDLIKSIREEEGKYFCIGVAGLPDCNDEKLMQLKTKVDSGADFILTQAFFEPKLYSTFVARCKEIGLIVPIIPGVYPIESYQQLSKFIGICKIKVSKNILDVIKDNEESKKKSGKEITKELIQSIGTETGMKHFHIFTMNNLANTVTIIKLLV